MAMLYKQIVIISRGSIARGSDGRRRSEESSEASRSDGHDVEKPDGWKSDERGRTKV